MSKDAEKYQRRQVRRSMFRTVAQNLIRQLQENGCAREDLIGFANEVLQSIIDQGFSGTSDAKTREEGSGGIVRRVEDLPVLSPDGTTPLTDDMSLGRVTRDDVSALKRWLGDEAVAQSLAEHTLPYIIEAASSERPHADQAVFVLRLDEDRKPVGLVGLIHIDKRTSQGELVKMIGDPSQRGKGLAKRATQMLVDFGFDTLNLNRIYLRTLGGNMKNIRLNESLGFKFEGVLRQSAYIGGRINDVIVMGMITEDRGDSQA